MIICNVINLKVSFPDGVNNAINEEIEEFVKKLSGKGQSAEYYVNKRNASLTKAQEDMFLGKKSEFFVMQGLFDVYKFPLIKPDTKIHVGNKKGWSADLPFNQINECFPDTHVKACSRRTYNWCNDYSWTWNFGNNDKKYGKDDLFKNYNPDLIALVFMEEPQDKSAIIKAILPWNIVREYLEDPIKPELKRLKKCLYYKTLVANIKNIEIEKGQYVSTNCL